MGHLNVGARGIGGKDLLLSHGTCSSNIIFLEKNLKEEKQKSNFFVRLCANAIYYNDFVPP